MMGKRGKKMVAAAAAVQMLARDEDPEELEDDVPIWEKLAKLQEPVTHETLLSAAQGLSVALQDQSSCSRENWRPVTVRLMREKGEVHIFDHFGDIIHEPSDRIIRGRQKWDDFMKAFDGKLGFKKFRTPLLRREPRERLEVSAAEPRRKVGGEETTRLLMTKNFTLESLVEAGLKDQATNLELQMRVDAELSPLMDNGVRPHSQGLQVMCPMALRH